MVLNNKLLPLESNHLNSCLIKSGSRIFEDDNFKQTICSYMPLNACWFSEESFQIDMERVSAMTRATFVIFWPKLSSFIDMLLYLGELYRLLGPSSCCMFILVKKLSSFIYMLLYPGELYRLLGASSCCMFILVKKELIPIL